MQHKVYLNPAHQIVRTLGEAIIQQAGDGISRRQITTWRCCRAVARVIDVHPTRVFRWMRPKAAGGRNGLVPDHYQRRLLEYARANEVGLGPEDFFCGQMEADQQKCSVVG